MTQTVTAEFNARQKVYVSEKFFNALMAQYLYLGYTQPVGEHLKYLAFSGDRPIACLAFSSAAYHSGAIP